MPLNRQQARTAPARQPAAQSAQQHYDPPIDDVQPPQCKGCGVVVKMRNDGTPWKYCFDCNSKMKAQTG